MEYATSVCLCVDSAVEFETVVKVREQNKWFFCIPTVPGNPMTI